MKINHCLLEGWRVRLEGGEGKSQETNECEKYRLYTSNFQAL